MYAIIYTSKRFKNIPKGCARHICASLYLNLKESTYQTRKKVFYFTSKAFSLSRKSNFRILLFQISWRHQMPMHKTRNTFQWITWEVNTFCEWNLASLCHITKEKISSKDFTKNCALKTSSRPFCVCKEWSITSIGKWNFWSKLLILDM